MVMQWLNIFEGTPGALGDSGEAATTSVLTRVTGTVDRLTTEYLGAAKPYFVAFGVGTAAVMGACATWELSKGLFSYVLAKPLHLGKDLKKFGTWAVVTGANTGIGRVYALELALRGFNIVLVARNEEKLEVTAKEIRDIHGVFTKIVVVDFEDAGLDNYLRVQAQLQGLDIGVLVNNAGLGPEDPMTEFLDNPPDAEKCIAMINVNISGVVMMTRIILPSMVQTKKGCIINISSVNGDIPAPKSALYSGTKAFVDFFSRALTEEYKSKGIIVQCVMPGAVMTKMVQNKDKDSFFCVNPEDFVPSALAQVGLRSQTYGHWKHALHMKRKKVRTWLSSLL
ncbi:very-long-chain 3-oxoacyl-CoA reductase-like [Paramacrobiotus metropolitanus]|uniref:very-long-chain 3-oxoacyl-CoA reductase-like n=1 Tax=Paramacrobiotus metropolitanus TaxID=2943436 RepID=UPI002445902D|nr:very-long-chain 3-oxoacyl-CoA reductase-like [Paramacrobiotus metropolitanus]